MINLNDKRPIGERIADTRAYFIISLIMMTVTFIYSMLMLVALPLLVLSGILWVALVVKLQILLFEKRALRYK